jgi:hypothetical protein
LTTTNDWDVKIEGTDFCFNNACDDGTNTKVYLTETDKFHTNYLGTYKSITATEVVANFV